MRYQNLLAAQLQKDERIAKLEASLAEYQQHLGKLQDALHRAEHTEHLP